MQEDDVRRAELARRITERRSRATHPERGTSTLGPLTEGQARLWLAWRLAPERNHRAARRYVVHGRIDRPMMEAALTALLEDAETLRCSYPEIDGVPMQQVHPVAAVPVRWVEATDPASLATIERSIEEALDAPFDLRTAVPTEVVLIRVADDDHRLVILSHHISLDGWSEALLARHLRDRYRAVRSGVGAAGAEADSRPRFLDVAAWSATAQTATVGPDLARALEGADAVDPWTEHDPGKETELTVLGLDRITVEALSDLARQEGTTLFAALVAAASLVLGDAWDLDRPIVAVSVAGRTDVAAEDLLGRFAVLRPLAGDLRGDPTVRELVRRVGQDLVATIDSTRVPLQEVLRALPAGVRRRFHSVSLQQRTFPRPPIPEGAPWIAPIDAPMDGDLPVDLAADLLPDGSVRLVLRTTPPEPLEEVVPAVAALLPTAMRLLPDLADDRCSAAAARVRSAELPPSAEAETPLRRRPVTTVVDRIRTIASTEPSAPAVEAPTGTIDYAALVAAMDDVAARLHAIGLVPGEAVVVTGPRCAGTIVAMLGVLQAGGVMVPLPTNLPMGAMAERIDAAGARRVITVGSITVGAVPVGSAEVGARVDLRLDEHGRVLDGPAPAAAHPSGPTPDDPAYVFFTSGTSGRARSVVGVHHSLAQFVDWQRGAFGIGPDDRVAMLTSIGFDVVLRTIFLPLTAGACLVVPPDDLDAADVLPWTVEHSVSVLHLTPGLAATWMATGPTELPPGRLRWTFFAGEPLTGALVRRWRGHLPTPGNVVNLYGPTETTMARAAWCVPDVVEDDAILPVGWAIPGSRLLVVDGDGRPVGAGERGEIVVQTVHGTAGYGNDPEGWAARLLPTDHADEVRYRTGDAGVRRPDGTIVVLGRLDDEVKVEGTRVQPADVTARLRRLPGVAAAEVTVVEEDDGTLALLAAVVPADPSLTARDVRTGLGAELPAASVPRHVRLLDRLPLTVNGKVDRAAIRALRDTPGSGTAPEAPGLGDRMLELWREVFPEREVHPDTSFFDIGGQSLRAVRLLHRVRERFGVELPLQTVFEADTPAAMAERVATERGDATPGPDAAVGADAAAGPEPEGTIRLPVLRTQELYLDVHEVDPALARSPITAVRLLRGPLDVPALQQAFDRLVARHEALRTHMDIAGRSMVVLPTGGPRLELVDHEGPVPDPDVLRELLEASQTELGMLDDPPIHRARLHRYGPEAHLLLCVFHHAFVDGVSIAVLLEDLEELYAAIVAGRAPELPPLPSGLGDVVALERRQEEDGTIERELAWWRATLADPVPVLDLPTDRPRQAMRPTVTQSCRLPLSPSERARLEAFAAAEGTTTFRVVAAVWAAHLAELGAVDEVVLGMPTMLREVPGADRMVGMFVSTVPLRLAVPHTVTAREAVAAATAATSAAGRHRHVHGGRIRAALPDEFGGDRGDLFRALVNVVRSAGDDLGRDGLDWLAVGRHTSNLLHDLELRVLLQGDRSTVALLLYDGNLFDASTAEGILGGFMVRLRRALVDPGAPLRGPVGEHPDPRAASPEGRLAEIARTDPRRPAIVGAGGSDQAQACDDEALDSIDYRQLDERVNAIAGALRTADVAPGDLVGVHLGRGVDLIAALFAVHRAGAGYVPLDPDLPTARLELLAEDTRPTAVLADRDPCFPTGDTPVVRLDRPGSAPAAADPLVAHDPEAAAYVIHTSGSTGRPKGVVVPHRALASFVEASVGFYGFRPGDRVLQLHTPAFDSSVEEIFGAIAAGATIVARPPDLMGGMGHFLRRVEQQSVTVLDLPTSFWHALVQELEAGQLTLPSCVRLVIIGGQAADPGLTRRWFELVDPRVRLVNAYGPTEATVAGLTADLTPDALREGSPVPIGRPLPGVAVRIEPLPEDPETDVPVGSVGELLLGGAQVALGYLGRPEQTAERFVELDGVRWYRTGDRVRLRTDGQFEFLGRIDDQVKIRGYRIEPGEIEAALLELPEVREAAVLVRNGAGGDAELVAHVVAAPGASVTARDLLRGLARSLPSYMFPAQIRFHDDLPRTPGGKPDRRVLLEGSEAPPATAPSPSAPPPAAPVAERLPLTPAQQGLLYTHLLEPTSPALNVAFALRFEGPLDVSRLDAALRAVLTRHEGLRARIDLDDDGRPWQWVDPAEPMPLTIVDVAGATPEERAARLAELTGAPFRIRGEALVRAALLRDAPQDHTLVVVAHHLVIDATSVGVLIEELVGAYRDPNRGVGPDSPADRYADAVRSRAAAEEGPDLDWWLAHLADAPRAVGLPAAPSPGPDERRVCELGETMRRELDRTAAALRVTPFALACTAFALVVSELTGQDDLVLGIPMNDRDPTQARAVGMFVNTLPVRIRLDRDVPVRSVVQEVASSVFAALTHRSAAIGSVVARLGRGRGADARTLYTTAFQLLGDPDQPVDLRIPGLVVSTVRTGRPAASQYDLSVDVTTHGSGLAVRIDRRGSVLGADGGVLVERRFRDLLGSLLGDPDRTIASLLRPPAPAPTPTPAPTPAPAPVQVQVPPVVAGDPVLDVWREAFGDPSIGPDDDFFLSGGHSLLAVRLFSLLERRLGVELPMSLLFDHPTPRALGAAVLPTVEDGRVPAAVEVQAPAAQPASEPSPAPTRLGLTRAPLSFAQERFWLLRRMDDTDPYQIRLAWRLVGRLDVAAFGAAVDAVVARHEALRTRFRQYDDGVPYQLVDPPAPVPIAHHDLRTASDPMAALAAVEQELHRPFALDEEWPLRVALAREDDNVHVVVLVLHHIAADGEAVGRIARDLSVAYAAAVSGEDPSLPPPALQYVDHAVRQRADAQHPDSRIERDLAYWRERLDPPPEPLLLPRTGSASADGAAGLVRLTGEAELIAGIRRCAAELRTTATTLLLAATGIALARITGRSDLVIGLPVSERDTPGGGSPDGGASMGDTPVGVMVNTLPFRFRLDPSATVREVVQTVRADLLAALEHRSAPFDHVVRAVGAIRNGVESPLVDVALNVHEERRSATGGLDLTGLVATPVARLGRRTAGAKFDLTLTAELSDRLDLLLEHRSDGLETDVVASWGSMVLAVLAGILEDPDRPVDRIPSVDASTTRWLLEVCNGPARAYPRDERIDRLVARTAAAHPDRPAVVDASGGTTLDYRGLVEQAEALAERLRSAGVEPGDRVVLVLDRSPLLVVAMLACLRAGAAYVPVEPSQPEARTALVLEHVDAAAVVRTDALGQAVVEPTNPVRSDRATTEETGAAPAYVMSTSGSTGAPKGVVVPHRAVLRLVCGTDYLQLGPDDVVAFASNPAFDAATWEVWGALVHGARLVVLDRDTVTSADRLHAALREHGVTAMFVTTALFNLLTRHRPDLFSGLRAVLFGGEACDPAAVARVLAAGPPERVLHVYGPTESTTFACWSPIDRVPAGARTLPIGLPIANTTAHVLDDRGGLVPPGVVGELYLGGDGLALGYLGDPKLTERRFVPDPFRGSPDARLYRTGDLVRRRPDGELEFVGRVDRQVKVRGFRIEPEEIEAAMLTHPGVAAAVVETRRDPEGVTLVGYASGSIDERSLRRHLEQRLPAAMVPTRLVVRPDLPVNANGKLDRAALRAAADEVGPPPIPARPSVQRQDSSPAEPSGPVPALWAEVLGLVDPDPDATFFELGGHSLLAVQLLTAIQQTTGVELPLSTLFEHQTLRALAAVVDERRGGEQVGRDPLLVPLRPNGHGAPLFCIHPAGGHLFHYERLVAHLPEGRPVFGITAEGLDGRTPWAPSVEAMAERYIRAMRSLVPQGPFAVAGFSSGASVAYEAVRQLAATGDALDGLVLLDPPFHRQPPRSSTVEAALRRIREEGLHGLTNGLAHRFGAGAVRDRKARLRYAVARRRDVPVDAVTAGRVNQLHHQAILPAYRPEPAPTPIRTLLVRAVSDPTCVTVADEERTVWESLVGAPVTVCTVAGTHRGPESFLAEPRVVEVASAVHRFLDEQSLGQQGLDGRSGR